MKKLEIAQHANLIFEAYLLLYQWINNGDMETYRQKFADHYLSDLEAFHKRFDLISEMFCYAVDNMKADKDRIEYYFKERSPELSTFASLAILLDIHCLGKTLPTYQDRMEMISAGRRIKEFALNISGEDAANTPEEELSTISDLIKFIEASSFDQASKWEAIKIFSDQEEYYNEVSKILTDTAELLRSRYSAQIDQLSQEFYEYWSGYQKDHDVIDTIHDKLKISWRMSEKGSIVAPVIFLPFTVSITVDDIENRNLDYIHIGIMMDQRFELSDPKIKKEDIVEIGKLLSDKSKVDILEFVSSKSCYGKEIAKALDLSTATISYHVNTLLKIGFLQAEVIANKVYYSIRKERISKYLEDVKEYFTKL